MVDPKSAQPDCKAMSVLNLKPTPTNTAMKDQAGLDTMPKELFDQIIGHVDDDDTVSGNRNGLLALCSTSKSLKVIVTPHLYRKFSNLKRSGALPQLITTLTHRPDLTRHIQDMTLYHKAGLPVVPPTKKAFKKVMAFLEPKNLAFTPNITQELREGNFGVQMGLALMFASDLKHLSLHYECGKHDGAKNSQKEFALVICVFSHSFGGSRRIFLRKLQTLDHNASCSSVRAWSVLNIVPNIPSLQRLTMDCKVKPGCCEVHELDVNRLPRPSNLKFLSIQSAVLNMRSAANAASRCKALEELVVDFAAPSPDDPRGTTFRVEGEVLMSALTHLQDSLKSLTILALSHLDQGLLDTTWNADGFTAFTKLQHLRVDDNLFHNTVRDVTDTFAPFPEQLKLPPNLKTLTIRTTNLHFYEFLGQTAKAAPRSLELLRIEWPLDLTVLHLPPWTLEDYETLYPPISGKHIDSYIAKAAPDAHWVKFYYIVDVRIFKDIIDVFNGDDGALGPVRDTDLIEDPDEILFSKSALKVLNRSSLIPEFTAFTEVVQNMVLRQVDHDDDDFDDGLTNVERVEQYFRENPNATSGSMRIVTRPER